jgi:predicted DNA-binding transcriptional regulator AlpA
MEDKINQLQRLLTERDVADLLRVSVATIRRRRLLRQPPHPLKIGASVRYTCESILSLLAASDTDGVRSEAPKKERSGHRNDWRG